MRKRRRSSSRGSLRARPRRFARRLRWRSNRAAAALSKRRSSPSTTSGSTWVRSTPWISRDSAHPRKARRSLPDIEPVTMSEVGTKLDLARAYMDMGDPDGARNILEEVLHEGSVAQKQEAQRLMESLPG